MGSRDELVNDAEEATRAALDGRQATMYTSGPGIITAVDYTTMTCSVQPAIQGSVVDESGQVQYVNLPLLIHVPIVYPSCKGFSLTFPLIPGDEVFVSWAMRCIDAWWQSGGIQKPMEARMHDLSDGFAFPGPRSVPNVIPSISSTSVQLRNNTGTCYIEIAASGQINIVAPIGMQITGNLLVTGSIHSDVSIGTSTVSLNTHVHSGVTTGGGNSGPPV